MAGHAITAGESATQGRMEIIDLSQEGLGENQEKKEAPMKENLSCASAVVADLGLDSRFCCRIDYGHGFEPCHASRRKHHRRVHFFAQNQVETGGIDWGEKYVNKFENVKANSKKP